MQATAAMYGLPPVAMQAMAAGASPSNTTASSTTPGSTPAWHWVIPAYGIILIIVAGLYAWRLLRMT